MERQKAATAMIKFLVNHFQCDEEDVALDKLEMGTTWHTGQDFQSSYNVSFQEGQFVGRIYWSTTSQEVYL